LVRSIQLAPVQYRPDPILYDRCIMKSIIIIVTFMLFSGFGAWRAIAQAKQEPKLNVGILVFNDVQIIDYAGPYEVLGANGKRNVFLVAEKPDAITTNMGMRVIPNYSFENAPKIDILILPGGGNIAKGASGRAVGAQLQNPHVMKWVRETADQAKYVMSVCNGAFFLAAWKICPPPPHRALSRN
jgi:hypothetical protein